MSRTKRPTRHMYPRTWPATIPRSCSTGLWGPSRVGRSVSICGRCGQVVSSRSHTVLHFSMMVLNYVVLWNCWIITLRIKIFFGKFHILVQVFYLVYINIAVTGKTVEKFLETTQHTYLKMADWLTTNRLLINKDKTSCLLFANAWEEGNVDK